MATTFLPKRSSATSASPSGSSTSVSLEPSCPQVRLAWKATTSGNLCQVRWGIGAQTALTSDLAMLDGTVETFTKQDADTLAVIGTGTLYVICGHGD